MGKSSGAGRDRERVSAAPKAQLCGRGSETLSAAARGVLGPLQGMARGEHARGGARNPARRGGGKHLPHHLGVGHDLEEHIGIDVGELGGTPEILAQSLVDIDDFHGGCAAISPR